MPRELAAKATERFLYGTTRTMQELQRKVTLVAAADVPVLITGESGTGKEALALELHRVSPRRNNAFVRVNCAAIPGPLMEAELFGFERGAFTGAVARRTGKFELASGGSIFLDEIADLDPSMQAKLLHVLQDGNLALVGGNEEVTLDTRVICASNREMLPAVQSGAFRQDLFYRINVVHLHLPPLRQRREDLPELVSHFLQRHCEAYQRPAMRLSATLLEMFGAYQWPGNVRELENTLKQLVILQNEGELTRSLEARLREEIHDLAGPDGTVSLRRHVKAAVQRVEHDIILRALRHNRWNRKKTAQMLKISYRALLYKLKDCGLESSARETASTEA
jgi:two-component system response regulator AtoC